jgi:hypothetical protein
MLPQVPEVTSARGRLRQVRSRLQAPPGNHLIFELNRLAPITSACPGVKLVGLLHVESSGSREHPRAAGDRKRGQAESVGQLEDAERRCPCGLWDQFSALMPIKGRVSQSSSERKWPLRGSVAPDGITYSHRLRSGRKGQGTVAYKKNAPKAQASAYADKPAWRGLTPVSISLRPARRWRAARACRG